MQFMEATHLVEILREAGPGGASVKDIAAKATEIRRAKDPKAPEIDPGRTGACSCYVLTPSEVDVDEGRQGMCCG